MCMKITIEISDETVTDAVESANLFWSDPTRGRWNAKTMRLEVYDVEDDDKKIVLTREDFERGLAVLAVKEPHHYADLVEKDGRNSDMYTGDALVQCAAFGELKYG